MIALPLAQVLIVVPVALFLSSAVMADRRSDDAADSVRDSSLWAERESYRTSGSGRKKAKVSETGGAIQIDSMRGKGGGAAYLSAWSSDWTDSFSVTLDASFTAPAATKNSRSAFSGVGFGFDGENAYNIAQGYRTGVQLEMQQTKAAGRTIQLVARKNGQVVKQSAKRALANGVHGVELAWIANPVSHHITLQVFLDGAVATPYLELTGFDQVYSGRQSQGINMSLFGYSTGNQKFASTFDNVEWFGDEQGDDGDSDDAGWDDDDDHFDDHGGHGDDSDDNGDDDDDHDSDDDSPDQTTLAEFTDAIGMAMELHADGVLLKAEAEYGWIDMVLSNPANAGQVRIVRVRTSDGAVLVDATRAARNSEQEALSVAAEVTVDPREALANAASSVAAGSSVHEVELESEGSGPVWDMAFRTPAGAEAERQQSAD